MTATRVAMPGRTPRTRCRKPARPASPSTTSASGEPASIPCPTCSGRGVRLESSASTSCRALFRAFIASWSRRDLMKTDLYKASGGEVELFERAYEQRLAVMLTGPTGCGKTRLVEHMGQVLNRPLVTISCHDDLTSSDLVGRFLVS